MEKRHIITIDYQSYAVESATAATQLLTLLAKIRKVRRNTDADESSGWFYEDEVNSSRELEVTLKMNQPYRPAKPAKPPKAEKLLALPKPKKGSIQCICEHSFVAPKESCTHCGRPFSESHNRTHGGAIESESRLGLL
jgi:hypothetical protein